MDKRRFVRQEYGEGKTLREERREKRVTGRETGREKGREYNDWNGGEKERKGKRRQ